MTQFKADMSKMQGEERLGMAALPAFLPEVLDDPAESWTTNHNRDSAHWGRFSQKSNIMIFRNKCKINFRTS